MRKKYHLTDAEFKEWQALPQDNDDEARGNDTWIFWNKVCRARALDSASLLSGLVPDQFSALPLGHTLHWCYPMPLRCKKSPPEFVSVQVSADA